ncbi:DUF6362 family protein [Tardiphaga sp. 538_B7_N1_4]|uniref:DUF6362 family protein n=1 Tax=Tardiphaga sp. 538_B7_N1_4 TaxID=3240778 RepID=UPI003F244207
MTEVRLEARVPAASKYHSALKSVIKRAIIVLDALGDSEMRFQNQGQVWSRAINDAALAYGYTDATVRFIPTAREIAQAEIVADWLLWLGNNDGGVRRLVSWAHDEPVWRMAERERCSIRTIHNRVDRSVAAILKQFGGMDAEIQEIDEKPERAHPPNFMTPITGTAGEPVSQHGKVWINGIGFMKHGRRLNNGQNRISDRMMAHGG